MLTKEEMVIASQLSLTHTEREQLCDLIEMVATRIAKEQAVELQNQWHDSMLRLRSKIDSF